MGYTRHSSYDSGYGGHNFFSLVKPTPVVKWLLIATLGAFVVQLIAERVIGKDPVVILFGLNILFIMRVMVWQIITYMFLHGGAWHLLSNMIGLFFFGPHIERVFGPRRFLEFYVLAGVAAGLGWLAIDVVGAIFFKTGHGPCVGASGAVLGVLAAFGTLYPRQKVTILIFLFPVTMTARTLVIGYAIFSVFAMMSETSGGVAHAAHLFGLLVGYLYTRKFMRDQARGRNLRSQGFFSDLVQRFRKQRFVVVRKVDDGETPNKGTGSRPSESEVNRILDKISSEGMQSITREEQRILERASSADTHSRRSRR